VERDPGGHVPLSEPALIPYAAYYPAGDTASFLDCLKQAVLRRGLPLKLYTDQGKPFVNTRARIVCANPGVRLPHAKPCHAWSKGKVERLISPRTSAVRYRWLARRVDRRHRE